jgi:hypothetical protein
MLDCFNLFIDYLNDLYLRLGHIFLNSVYFYWINVSYKLFNGFIFFIKHCSHVLTFTFLKMGFLIFYNVLTFIFVRIFIFIIALTWITINCIYIFYSCSKFVYFYHLSWISSPIFYLILCNLLSLIFMLLYMVFLGW